MSDTPVTFGWESLNSLLSDGVATLVREHWKEIALDQEKVPLAIDWRAMLEEEKIGRFRVFSARRNGELIGYVAFKSFRPERYSTTLYINDDVFWLAPEERKGLTGYRMLKAAIAALPRPCKLQFKEKIGFQDGRVGTLLERLGLQPVEMLYSAFLE